MNSTFTVLNSTVDFVHSLTEEGVKNLIDYVSQNLTDEELQMHRTVGYVVFSTIYMLFMIGATTNFVLDQLTYLNFMFYSFYIGDITCVYYLVYSFKQAFPKLQSVDYIFTADQVFNFAAVLMFGLLCRFFRERNVTTKIQILGNCTLSHFIFDVYFWYYNFMYKRDLRNESINTAGILPCLTLFYFLCFNHEIPFSTKLQVAKNDIKLRYLRAFGSLWCSLIVLHIFSIYIRVLYMLIM